MAMKIVDGKKKLNVMTNIWDAFDLQENQIYYWKIGTCNLWMTKDKTEIYIASIHAENIDIQKGSDIPENLFWSRFALKDKVTSIEFVPIMPDRPVVVKPESSFYLTKNTMKNIYVRVPVWISINVAAKSKMQLLEIPSVILSNTWFGDLSEGELCYWLSSGARSQIEVDPATPFMAICPLTLQNQSDENLLVEKLAVRTENSTLYMHNGQLWSDMIFITYTGQSEISKVIFTGKPHKEIAGAIKISEPRKKQNKKLLVKTFDTFAEMHILGMPIKS
jgi:hypothetical protein